MKNIIFVFTSAVLIFFSNAYAQNAYYDSYKIDRVFKIMDNGDLLTTLKKDPKIDALLNKIDDEKYPRADILKYAKDASQNYNELVKNVNEIYKIIFEIVSSNPEDLKKQKNIFEESEEGARKKIEELDKKIILLSSNVNSNLSPQVNSKLIDINTNLKSLQCSENPTIKEIENFIVEKSKIDKIIYSLNSTSEILKTAKICTGNSADIISKSQDLLQDLITTFKANADLNNYLKNFEEIENQNKLKNYYKFKKDEIAEILERFKILVQNGFTPNSPDFLQMLTKSTNGQNIDPTKTTTLENKNDEISNSQKFSISEAAFIQAISDVMISKFKESLITNAISELIVKDSARLEYRLFNQTIDYISELKTNQEISVPVILKNLKKNIFSDFDKLPENIFNSNIVPDSIINPNARNIIKGVLPFLKLFKEKKHPVEILNLAAVFVDKSMTLDTDLKKSIKTVLYLQKNLRDLSAEKDNLQIWLPSDKILDILLNEQRRKLFIAGLINNTDDPEIVEMLRPMINEMDNTSQLTDETKNILLDFIVKLNKFEKSIESINKGVNDESIVMYFDSFGDFFCLFKTIGKKYKIEFDKNNNYEFTIRTSIEIIKSVAGKNYLQLINIMSKFIESKKYEFLKDFSKFIAVLDGIMSANSNAELEVAISNVVEKYGGYSLKRENIGTLSINSYLGLSFGVEYIGSTFGMEGEKAGNYGLNAPIGLNLSYGRLNLFAQVFDFTAPLNYRAASTEELPSDIKFKNLISPGLLFLINPSDKYPVAFGFGVQYMPELRKLNGDESTNYKSTKFGLYILYDLPLFNVFKF